MKSDILIKIGSDNSLIVGFQGCWYYIFYAMFHDQLILHDMHAYIVKDDLHIKQSQSLSAVLSKLNPCESTIRAIVAHEYTS